MLQAELNTSWKQCITNDDRTVTFPVYLVSSGNEKYGLLVTAAETERKFDQKYYLRTIAWIEFPRKASSNMYRSAAAELLVCYGGRL